VPTADRAGSTTSDPTLLSVRPPIQPPSVHWRSPPTFPTRRSSDLVTLQADASDPDGAIVQVEFRDGTNSLGVVSNSPYSLLWTNITRANDSITATAPDHIASSTTYDPTLLSVRPPNQPPTVQWLSP